MDGFTIFQRNSDGYWNATAMCQAYGKLVADYTQTAAAQELVNELSATISIPVIQLIAQRVGNVPVEIRGIWVRPG